MLTFKIVPKPRPFMKKQNTEVYLKPAIKTDVHSIGISMSPEASKNIAVKQAHAHMCCEAELGPEPRTPGEWCGGGAVEDVGRPCFPRRWGGGGNVIFQSSDHSSSLGPLFIRVSS